MTTHSRCDLCHRRDYLYPVIVGEGTVSLCKRCEQTWRTKTEALFREMQKDAPVGAADVDEWRWLPEGELDE
jgi:hypothetical protein